MKKYYLKDLTTSGRNELLKRKSIINFKAKNSVQKIVNDVKKNGLKSAIKYAKKLDGFRSENFRVNEKEFNKAERIISPKLKTAIYSAYRNIYKFHEKQFPKNYSTVTIKGVKCVRKFIPLENVGLYIPSGTAPLPSTMLMLGIPAQIAGCKRVVAASPVKKDIHPAILYAAKLCGVNEFLKIGGAHVISLYAYGDRKFKKVDKIFGPGNKYVTTAKGIISTDPEGGCAIDMLAGPSELLIIADEKANPEFVSADLLSQAEHGNDSIVVLVTTSELLVKEVEQNLSEQIEKFSRKDYAKKALKNSFSLIVKNFTEAFEFSNDFAPEHLIINIKNPDKYIDSVINAGSVFLGNYSPESAGDYASGTNHSLPTYGFARSIGGVSVEMFMKAITFQSITKQGLKNLSETVIALAEAESLQAHAEAVKIRLK